MKFLTNIYIFFLNSLICIKSLDLVRNKVEEFDAISFHPWGSSPVKENIIGSFLNELKRYCIALTIYVVNEVGTYSLML